MVHRGCDRSPRLPRRAATTTTRRRRRAASTPAPPRRHRAATDACDRRRSGSDTATSRERRDPSRRPRRPRPAACSAIRSSPSQPVAEVDQPVGLGGAPRRRRALRRRPGRHRVPHHARPRRRLAGRRGRRPHRPHRAPTASAACSGSRSPPTARWPGSTTPTTTATPSSPSTRSPPTARSTSTPSACCCTSTSRTRTTTAAICNSVPTACSTWRWATAGRVATPNDGRAIRPRCSASCCGSTPRRRAMRPTRSPPTTRSRRAAWATSPARPRCGRGDSATRGGSRSIPLTADLWIADVGQNEIEEIDAVGATAEHPAGWGANFGWSAYEGNDRFNDDVRRPGQPRLPGVDVHARRGMLDLRRRGVPRHGDRRAGSRPTCTATTAAASCGRSTSRQVATSCSSEGLDAGRRRAHRSRRRALRAPALRQREQARPGLTRRADRSRATRLVRRSPRRRRRRRG